MSKRNSRSVPSRCNPSSMVSQVVALKEGQSCCRVIDIDTDVTLGEVKEYMTAWRKRALANAQSSVKYAKTRIGKAGIGRVFTIETSCYMSPNYTLSIIVTVRRASDYAEL